MKNLFIVLLICLSGPNLFSQSFTLAGTRNTSFQSKTLQASFEDYRVFSMDANALLKYCANHRESFNLDLNLEDFQSLHAGLKNSGIVSEHYTTNEPGAISNDKTADLSGIYTFNGSFTANPTDKMALTVARDFIFGYFERDGNRYFIEPLWYFDKSVSRDLYVVYESGAVKENIRIECEALEFKKPPVAIPDDTYPGSKCKPLELELAIASDYSMVVKYGTPSAVMNHNIGVINNVQTNYVNDFTKVIIFKIVTQWVSPSTASDPATGNTASAFLTEFRTWCVNGGFGLVNYDLGHLRTAKLFPLGGGLYSGGASFLGGLCALQGKYGFCSEYSDVACLLQKTTAHEFGHSFGGTHPVPPQNPPTIMDQGAFCTDLWAPGSIAEINNGIATQTCLSVSDCTAYPPGLPTDLQYICTDEEECYTFNAPCVGGYTVGTNDPNLKVTTSGTTICLQSLVEGQRTARVYVTAYNHCGITDPTSFSIVWYVNIDDPAHCPEDSMQVVVPRQAEVLGADGIRVVCTNTVLQVLDDATAARVKSIQIFDLSGKLLDRISESDTRFEVPLDHLPKGLFVVKVNAGTAWLVSKFSHQ